MGKKLRILLISLLIILVAMQFYRPQRNASQYREVTVFEKETGVPGEVRTILENKCYDCHSNQTVYPWYANVAPVSLWIDDHIVEGREHFDASEWASYDIEKKDHKLEELIEEVEEDKMPLPSYTWIHDNISGEEKEMLIQWAREARILMASVAVK
jgi:hypothetical protein